MSVAENIRSVRAEIEKAAEKCGRDASSVKLIAVTKTKPVEMMEEAAACGALEFGENRPQEIVAKFPAFEGKGVSWHLIGQLQKNKVRHIIDKVCLIHSVDSFELAAEIDKRAAAIGKIQDILIQVNVSGEDSKSGVAPGGTEELCRKVSSLGNVRIKGLMTISVMGLDYAGNYRVFSALKKLAEDIDSLGIDGVSMKELSMGMTHDYDAAIAAGATMIRVGTAIFGERQYNV